MTIITRATKGTPLTYAELDGNFTQLDARTAQAWHMDGLEPTLRSGVGNPAELMDFIGNTIVYGFVDGSMSEVFINWDVPLEFAGGNIYAALHWSPGASTASGNTYWGLEYTTAPVNGVFGATNTFYITGTTAGTAYKHIQSISDPYVGAVPNERFFIRLYRDGNNALDTFAGTAYLLGIDFYYQVNKFGTPSFVPPYT